MSDIDDEPFEMVIRNTQVLSHGRQVAGLDPAQARTQQAETPNVFGPFLDNTVLGKARPMDEVTYVGCCSCSRLIPNLDKFLPNYAVLLVLVMTIVSATYNWQKAAIFAGGCLMLHFGYALVLTSLGSKSLLRGSFFVVCVGLFVGFAILLCPVWAWAGAGGVVVFAFLHALLAKPRTAQEQQQQESQQQAHQQLP
eukprot:c12850_g1_i1.p1 GENE.c12850_g1_i1~~c12850_g1_i1.p1  ORF type:complete len:230 (-),score=43.46 c12850_g1_i1:263-850(-)